ncbi:hypothetical protein GS538_09215 [Rhodococcus hoagii]|nr:hypothetical protein [Prescottella equi]
MITWKLTATQNVDTTVTGAAVDRATAAAELITAARDAVMTTPDIELPVFTLEIDGETVGLIFTGERPTGGPDRDRSLEHLDQLENKIGARDHAADQP